MEKERLTIHSIHKREFTRTRDKSPTVTSTETTIRDREILKTICHFPFDPAERHAIAGTGGNDKLQMLFYYLIK